MYLFFATRFFFSQKIVEFPEISRKSPLKVQKNEVKVRGGAIYSRGRLITSIYEKYFLQKTQPQPTT